MSKSQAAAAEPAMDDLLCPIRFALDVVGGKWKLPIICALSGDVPQRYGAIRRRLDGITNMMLAQSLKELEVAGLVLREQFNEVPPHVEYSLTPKGRGLLPVIAPLYQWGADSLDRANDCGSRCNRCNAAA
ncbi:MAG: helix-turn-helix transcriptional regulator [Coriobacteriales bacterium]|jgi:DNA-binding HxlR family transcriptional regulator|nr:helix-turn-helix transcriptional regulator [Coriobacteriales bacterium]